MTISAQNYEAEIQAKIAELNTLFRAAKQAGLTVRLFASELETKPPIPVLSVSITAQ